MTETPSLQRGQTMRCAKPKCTWSHTFAAYTWGEQVLWLARAHHWDEHSGKPPEGLP